MYYLIYLSNATKRMHEKDLSILTQQSKDYNHSHRITGLLAYLEGISDSQIVTSFMHVLEGSKKEVIKAFERIKGDDRHCQVVLHKEGYVKKRNFLHWSMKSERIKLKDNPEISLFFDLNKRVLQSETFKESNAILDFLMAF